MKKNKTEKRRLQLNKRHEKNNTQKMEQPRFSKPTDSKLFVKASGSEAVRAPLNKRLVAIILAIVMVVGLIPAGIFMLRPKAALKEVELKPVTMSVRLDGSDTGDTIDVDAGVISTNAPQNYEGAELRKAVVVKNGVETQIYAVGNKSERDYYSINENGFTGVEKVDGEVLVLIYAHKYNLNIASNPGDGGSYLPTTAVKEGDNYYIYGGDNLVIKDITPAKDHKATTVTYRTSDTSGSERITKGAATIPANMINGDITVNVNFPEVDEYTVKDARDISSSKYYERLSGLDNHGGTSNVDTSDTPTLNSVEPGQKASFYIFSQANSTNSEKWRLNMLSINGVDLEYPQNVEETTDPQDLNADSKVTVKFVSDNTVFTGDNSRKKRAVYLVEITNVHEDLEVAYFFTDTNKRTIIVKGLNGIDKTGAAVEDQPLIERYYSFTSNNQNLYETFYTAAGFISGYSWYPSDNMILYTVKPGYNPYTIETAISYNYAEPTESGVRAAAPDTVEEVILAAGESDEGYGSTGRFNTSVRHWGPSVNEAMYNRNESTYLSGLRRKDLLLKTLQDDKANTWYAVALAQNSAKVQQLYLNAKPYHYFLQVDTNPVNEGVVQFNDESYERSGDYYVEKGADNYRTVEQDGAYFTLPEEPTKDGYVFQGWYVCDENGAPLDENTYQAKDRLPLSADLTTKTLYRSDKETQKIQDQIIRVRAIWQDVSSSSKAYVSAEVYVQNLAGDVEANGKTYDYLADESGTELQFAPKYAALLNYYHPENEEYYEINDNSVLDSRIKQGSGIDEDNQFSVYYDYRLEDLKVNNTVVGYPKTKEYTVTVTLEKPDESPVSAADAKTLMTVSGAELVEEESTETKLVYRTTTLKNGESILFEDAPYGWTYTVDEVLSTDGDYKTKIEPSSGRLTEDTGVDITNSVNDSGLTVEKHISGPDENGNYSLKLEAFANGVVKNKSMSQLVPTDFILVLDQSGSMAAADMPTGYSPAGASWTCETAKGKYYYDGENYYPVVYKDKPTESFHEIEPNTTKIKDYTTYTLGIGGDKDEITYYTGSHDVDQEIYFLAPDGAYYRVHTYSQGLAFRYHATLYYYDSNDIKHNLGTWTYTWTPLGIGINNRVTIPLYTNSTVKYESPSWSHPVGRYYADIDRSHSYGLYYTDNNGVEHKIPDSGTSTSTSSGTVYRGNLYSKNADETRTEALIHAAQTFATTVKTNAEENLVDHKIAVVGFSSANNGTNYNNTEVLTGCDISTAQRGSHYSAGTDNGWWYYFPYDGADYTPIPKERPNTSTNYATNYNGPQYWKYNGLNASTNKGYEKQADSETFKNALVSAVDDSENINKAIKSITAYGGTEPEYGLRLANSILDSRENAANRNAVVIFFTDGHPGNTDYSDQITAANNVVLDAKAVKEKATIYSIGVFSEGDNQPLTYTLDYNDANTEIAEASSNYLETDGSYLYFRGNDVTSPFFTDTISDYMRCVSSEYPNATEFYNKNTTDPQTGISGRDVDSHVTDTQYYFNVADEKGLENAFKKISAEYQESSVSAETDLILQDVITDNFNVTNKTVTFETWGGTGGDDGVIWDQDGPSADNVPNTVDYSWGDDDKTLTVYGFNYGENYIGKDKHGQKLIVTINGITPEELGYDLESNTNQSGIIERLHEAEDDPEAITGTTLLEPFEIPSINRVKHNLIVEGDDQESTYTVKFKIEKSDGNGGYIPVTGVQNVLIDGATPIQPWTFDTDGTYVWTTDAKAGDTGSVIFENIDPEDEDYRISVISSINNEPKAGFKYSVDLQESSEKENFDTAYVLPRSEKETTTIITSSRILKDVIIKEVTKGSVDTNDYSDKGKLFDIEVTLLDEDGQPVGDTVTYGSTGYVDGKLVLSMKDQQTRKIQIPAEYSVSVREIDPYEYQVSYSKTNVETTELENETPIEASDRVQVHVDDDYTRVTVINTLDTTPQTGLFDNLKVNPFIIGAIILAIVGAGWLMILEKRKRQLLEQ